MHGWIVLNENSRVFTDKINFSCPCGHARRRMTCDIRKGGKVSCGVNLRTVNTGCFFQLNLTFIEPVVYKRKRLFVAG